MNPFLIFSVALFIVVALRNRRESIFVVGIGASIAAFYFSSGHPHDEIRNQNIISLVPASMMGNGENQVGSHLREWPSLVGKDASEAKQKIQEDRPELKVILVPENSMVTMDYREDRVRVFFNKDNLVVGVPRTG